MRKLLIITFTIILIYINMGYYIQVSVQKEMAKEEMIQRMLKSIPDSSLTIFELKSIEKQIEWEEENKEFWLNNDIYDVVKITESNGKTYIYCLNDKNEEKVIQDYIKVAKKDSKNSGENKSLKQIFSVLYNSITKQTLSFTDVHTRNNFPSYTENILQQDEEVFSPPPEPALSL